MTQRNVLFPPIKPYRVHRLKVSRSPRDPCRGVRQSGRQARDPSPWRAGRRHQPDHAALPRSGRLSHRHLRPARIGKIDAACRARRRTRPGTSSPTWNAIREHLGIERWQVFGGSWGSCLALAYGETHPDRVSEFVLRGIFTLRRKEILWFYQDGASCLLPDAWEDFIAPIPEQERGDFIAAYYKRLTGGDPEIRLACARAWSMWEGAALSLLPDPGAGRRLRRARIRHRLCADRMPLFRQSRLLRKRRPAHRQCRSYSATFPGSSSTAATTLHAGRHRLGPAPGVAGGGTPHRAGQRPRDDRARHRPRTRRGDRAV